MIARHIECNVKPEKYNEFKATYEREILPILKKQTGFLDSLTLVHATKLEHTITISLWNTQLDVENYNKREFPKVLELLKPFLKDTPRVEYFNVEHTTMRKMETAAA